MEWSFVRKAWDKWSSQSIGSLGEPLKSAILLNYDPTGPSRLLSIIAEHRGINTDPIELSQFLGFIARDKLRTEIFTIGTNQYLVTTIHENWFAARCVNTSKPAGEGVIVIQTTGYILVAQYDGPIGSACRAMAALDQFAWQLSRKNL